MAPADIHEDLHWKINNSNIGFFFLYGSYSLKLFVFRLLKMGKVHNVVSVTDLLKVTLNIFHEQIETLMNECPGLWGLGASILQYMKANLTFTALLSYVAFVYKNPTGVKMYSQRANVFFFF